MALRNILSLSFLLAVFFVTTAKAGVDNSGKNMADEKKFTAICQYWVNTLVNESGYKFAQLYNYNLRIDSRSAFLSFDKAYLIILQVDSYKGQSLTITIAFKKEEDCSAFSSSTVYKQLKKNIPKKGQILQSPTVINAFEPDIENEKEYKKIYAGTAETPYPFDVIKTFELLAQKAKQPINPNENSIAHYKEQGNIYYNGVGVIRHLSTARIFYEQAWALGDDTAALFLGYLYNDLYGDGITDLKDPSKARAYFDSACMSGNTTGFYCIGKMYQSGFGETKADLRTALNYYEKGAAKGNPRCLDALYKIYLSDKDFKNPEKAKEYKERIDYIKVDLASLRDDPDFYVPSLKITN